MALKNFILSGDMDLSKSVSVKLADFSNLVFRELGVRMFESARMVLVVASLMVQVCVSMQNILGGRHRLKVFKPVIRLDPVLMIDLFPFGNRATKG